MTLQRQQRHQQDTILPSASPPEAAAPATPNGVKPVWIAAGLAAAVVLAIVIWVAVQG
ncbi:MAG: hypothetical protein HYZ27_06930 [Deltaproteobacteria bacterium]|nr:hypothetical protein [Deltaproteobacteria bacterium]